MQKNKIGGMRLDKSVFAVLLLDSLAVAIFYIFLSVVFFKKDSAIKKALFENFPGFSICAGILVFISNAISLEYGKGNTLHNPEVTAILTLLLFILQMIPGYWFIARRTEGGIAQMRDCGRCLGALAIDGMVVYMLQFFVSIIGTGDLLWIALTGVMTAQSAAFFLMLIWASFIKMDYGNACGS
jgi:hypothetical protein